jgi:hypothetical protein
MTLDQLWQFVLFILKKEESGGVIDPISRNRMLSIAQQRLYLSEYRVFEQTQAVSDSLSIFKNIQSIPVDSNGFASLPIGQLGGTYYHCTGLSVSSPIQATIEQVTDTEYHESLASKLNYPTPRCPIALFANNKIQFQPLRSTNVLMSFLEYPPEPYYDWYVDANGMEQYSPPSTSLTVLGVIDPNQDIISLTLTGLTPENTDYSGKLYVSLVITNESSGNRYLLNFYKDSAQTLLVATASYFVRNFSVLTFTTGVIQANNSGILGFVTINIKPLILSDTSSVSELYLLGSEASELYCHIIWTLDTLEHTWSNLLSVYSDSDMTTLIDTFTNVVSGTIMGDGSELKGYITLTEYVSNTFTATSYVGTSNIQVWTSSTSKSVEYVWRYEDEIRIIGFILEMCGLYIENDKITQYSQLLKI